MHTKAHSKEPIKEHNKGLTEGPCYTETNTGTETNKRALLSEQKTLTCLWDFTCLLITMLNTQEMWNTRWLRTVEAQEENSSLIIGRYLVGVDPACGVDSTHSVCPEVKLGMQGAATKLATWRLWEHMGDNGVSGNGYIAVDSVVYNTDPIDYIKSDNEGGEDVVYCPFWRCYGYD